MGQLLSIGNHPETSNAECEKSPVFENEPRNRGVIYMSQNYAHRCNTDGSFDSICLHCFQTVASAPIGAALVEHEMQHRCIALGLQGVEANRPSGNRPVST
jgi:hypothetical protein